MKFFAHKQWLQYPKTSIDHFKAILLHNLPFFPERVLMVAVVSISPFSSRI